MSFLPSSLLSPPRPPLPLLLPSLLSFHRCWDAWPCMPRVPYYSAPSLHLPCESNPTQTKYIRSVCLALSLISVNLALSLAHFLSHTRSLTFLDFSLRVAHSSPRSLAISLVSLSGWSALNFARRSLAKRKKLPGGRLGALGSFCCLRFLLASSAVVVISSDPTLLNSSAVSKRLLPAVSKALVSYREMGGRASEWEWTRARGNTIK